MKKYIPLILIPYFAGCSTSDEKIFTTSSRFWSGYMTRNGFVSHDEPVIQNDISISLPKGFYLCLWHSFGINDTDLSGDLGDEIDYIAGWNHNFVSFARLDISLVYINFLELDEMPKGDGILPTFVVDREFKLGNHSLVPYAKEEIIIPAQGERPERGILSRAGIKHIWDTSLSFDIQHKVEVLYDDGALGSGFDSGVLARYELGLTWPTSENIVIEAPSTRIILPLTDLDDKRKEDFVIGFGIRVKF